MKCPSCGGAQLITDARDYTYQYKNQTVIFKKIRGDYCDSCGEVYFNDIDGQKFSTKLLKFNKKVNASLFDPSLISSVRKKLKLDQKEAGKIFGGGVNAFSRYENGKSKPPIALIKLFFILDQYPELLELIKCV